MAISKLQDQPDPDVAQIENTEENFDGLALSYSHVVFNRTLIENGGSFNEFSKWAKAARLTGANFPAGSDGRRVAGQLSAVMGAHEQKITAKLLAFSASGGLKQDARGSKVMNLLHLVLWSWPRGLAHTPLPGGVVAMNGDHGPWLVRRVAAVSTLGSDHSADAKTKAAEAAILSLTRNDAEVARTKETLRHYVSDNAADAVQTGKLLQRTFPHMTFQAQGAMHSAALVLKTTLGCDAEVEAVDQLLVSRKACKWPKCWSL